jgi:hypothetical protein
VDYNWVSWNLENPIENPTNQPTASRFTQILLHWESKKSIAQNLMLDQLILFRIISRGIAVLKPPNNFFAAFAILGPLSQVSHEKYHYPIPFYLLVGGFNLPL